MKKILTLSIFLLSCLLASAQVCSLEVDNSRVIIGTAQPSPAVYAGLHNARVDVNTNEIAMVAAAPCTSAYYAIYDEGYRVIIACGKFSKLKAGEYDIVKVGRPADKCRVVLSVTPFIAHQ